MKGKLIISSPKSKGKIHLEELLNKAFYSTTYKIDDDNSIINKNGYVKNLKIISKNGRYKVYII